jgi:hypothetical protein
MLLLNRALYGESRCITAASGFDAQMLSASCLQGLK